MGTKRTSVIGKLAVCNRGHIGIIEQQSTRRSAAGSTKYYRGRTISGQPWSSTDPRIINDTDATFVIVPTANVDQIRGAGSAALFVDEDNTPEVSAIGAAQPLSDQHDPAIYPGA